MSSRPGSSGDAVPVRGASRGGVVLASSTGSCAVDAFVAELIGAFEAAFPGRVGGYYVIGSYADGSAVPLSDLDLVVLFSGRLREGDARAAWRVGGPFEPRCPVRLDLTISGEDDPTWEKGYVKLASRLLYGADARAGIALPPPTLRDVWDGMHYAERTVKALRGVERLVYPLDFPDAQGEFYGYDAVREPDWYPPGTARGLRELVNAVTLMATALTPPGSEGGVLSKAQAVALYRARVGGRWASYLEVLYEHAKLRCGYLIPEAAADRFRLRALCRRTLGFENHFLRRYRQVLLDLLRSADEGDRGFAAARLREVVVTGEGRPRPTHGRVASPN